MPFAVALGIGSALRVVALEDRSGIDCGCDCVGVSPDATESGFVLRNLSLLGNDDVRLFRLRAPVVAPINIYDGVLKGRSIGFSPGGRFFAFAGLTTDNRAIVKIVDIQGVFGTFDSGFFNLQPAAAEAGIARWNCE